MNVISFRTVLFRFFSLSFLKFIIISMLYGWCSGRAASRYSDSFGHDKAQQTTKQDSRNAPRVEKGDQDQDTMIASAALFIPYGRAKARMIPMTEHAIPAMNAGAPLHSP